MFGGSDRAMNGDLGRTSNMFKIWPKIAIQRAFDGSGENLSQKRFMAQIFVL